MSAIKKLLANPCLTATTKNFGKPKLLSSCGPKSQAGNGGSKSAGGGGGGNEKNYSKRMIKFKKVQEFFQRDDGKPIFLKCGARDRLLYLSTVGLGLVGLVLDFQYYCSYIFSDN